MAVAGSPGAQKATRLLNDVPDHFREFCRMDQITFVDLADWLVKHADRRNDIPYEVSVEECLFVFFDIAAHNTSFRIVSHNWGHDVKLVQTIFTNMMEELSKMHETEQWSPECPPYSKTRSRWRLISGSRAQKSRGDGLYPVGLDRETGDGIMVSQEQLIKALSGLNNFIYEHQEFYS